MNKSKNFFRNLVKPFRSNSSNVGENVEDLEKIAQQEQKSFLFETLVAATKDFHPHHKLGEGGFGPVYRGKLDDGREIAVKKLSQHSSQGKKEFENEAKSLDKVLFKPNRKEELDWKRSQKNSSFSSNGDARNLLEWVYKLYQKGKGLEIMDVAIAPLAPIEQVAICIQIGLLCVQSDPKARPDMHRVVIMLSKKPGHLDEPMRPGIPGTRYRRSRLPPGSSSTAGASGFSDSRSSESTFNINTNTATASASTSGLASSSNSDPHGKRPMKG
ncbi:hypothetical protein V6N13_012764 [Hibiscus sabdariffa]